MNGSNRKRILIWIVSIIVSLLLGYALAQYEIPENVTRDTLTNGTYMSKDDTSTNSIELYIEDQNFWLYGRGHMIDSGTYECVDENTFYFTGKNPFYVFYIGKHVYTFYLDNEEVSGRINITYVNTGIRQS